MDNSKKKLRYRGAFSFVPPQVIKLLKEDKAEYEYAYPGGLDLTPGSDLHTTLANDVYYSGQSSHNVMSKYYPEWRKIDKMLAAVVDEVTETELERLKKGKGFAKTRQTVSVPLVYAIMETLVAQMVDVFLTPPYFRYKPQGPEDVIPAKLLEILIQWQSMKKRHGLAIHTMIRDAICYGIGPVHVRWVRQRGKVIQKVTPQEEGIVTKILKSLLGDTFESSFKGDKRRVKEDIVFEGNLLESIDPYNFLPDTSVPIHKIQEGEFVGFIERTSLSKLLTEEKNSQGEMFNVRYLNNLANLTSSIRAEERPSRPTKLNDFDPLSSFPVDVIHMYKEVVPSSMGLGKGDYPEKWLISLAADGVVIAARKLDTLHGKFPVAIAAPEYDGHSVVPISKLGLITSEQEFVNFLYSSHEENVKKVINDMFFIDPSIINVRDMLDPAPGKFVRVNRRYRGRGKIKEGVEQFKVVDVTQNHVRDAGLLQDSMFRISGSPDSLQGIQRYSGERRSATESGGAQRGAITRVDRSIRIVSLMAMMDIGEMVALNTQYKLSKSMFLRVTGRTLEDLSRVLGKEVEFVEMAPEDLAGQFDVETQDATSTGAQFADSWIQYLSILGANPQLAYGLDMPRMSLFVANLLGAKNVEDFVIKQSQGGLIQSNSLMNQEAATLTPPPGALIEEPLMMVGG